MGTFTPLHTADAGFIFFAAPEITPLLAESNTGIGTVPVILRCTILISSWCFCVGMKAHQHNGKLTSPLSEETSHPAENDKYSKSGLVLDTCVCRLKLQLPLVAMVFAHSETGSIVGKQMKKIRIYGADSRLTVKMDHSVT